jgi:hypothetical protein
VCVSDCHGYGDTILVEIDTSTLTIQRVSDEYQ